MDASTIQALATELLHFKNQTYEKLLSSTPNTKDMEKLTSEYQETKATVQRETCCMKNEWWEKMESDSRGTSCC
jgi:hypothetical protein